MNIESHDAALEARIQKQLQSTASGSVEEVLLRLLETQEEQDRWLLENRETINAKIRRGIEQLDRGEGIPEDQLDAHPANLKSQTQMSVRFVLAPQAALDLVEIWRYIKRCSVLCPLTGSRTESQFLPDA